MNAVPALKFVSIEDYLTSEETSQEKHEYYAGEVYAMAGASVPHNRVVRNTLTEIDGFLKGKDCEVFPSDLKINVKTKSSFVYPDLSIVCNGLEFYRDRNDIVTNPSVIIEVICPHTERYDRGKKFMLYRQIETLQEYILVSSTEVLVERFKKSAGETWTLKDYKTLDDDLVIETINYKAPLAEIYRDVVFTETDPVDGDERR